MIDHVSETDAKVEWLARQMYSRERPIGRDQIFAAFTAVLAELVGATVDEPAKIAEREVSGAEFLGYWATHQTWRIAAGGAALICTIDPILASMGVSGEDHTWRSEGLPDGVEITGTARSSGREPSWARIVIRGLPEPQARGLVATFRAAFGPILSAAELDAELG